MLNEVRDQIKNGVDFIKIAASGESAILTPGGGSVPAFRAEEMKIIVEEAHRLGRRVTAHARSGQSVVDCIDAGIDWIMHADFMDREAGRSPGRQRHPVLSGADLHRQHRRVGPHRRLQPVAYRPLSPRSRPCGDEPDLRATATGVTMMCGTDTGFAVTPYGEWHARELELFVTLLGYEPARGDHLRHPGTPR